MKFLFFGMSFLHFEKTCKLQLQNKILGNSLLDKRKKL